MPDLDLELEDIGELDIAEYLVFLLSVDTYIRYLTAHKGAKATDDMSKHGVLLMRAADRIKLEDVRGFFLGHLNEESDAGKRMVVEKAFKLLPTQNGVAQRAMRLRGLLKRGGTTMINALFSGNKARQEVKKALTAAAMDDCDKALDILAAIPVRNVRMRKWIDDAAALAGSQEFQNPVTSTAAEAVAATTSLMDSKVSQNASPGTEEAKAALDTHTAVISEVQAKATANAQRALEAAGLEDKPATTSEVHGIVAATVAAVISAPELPKNIPASFINNGRPLDDEQMAAALTDGRVIVAAGAGAGKSTTLVSRVSYLINERKQESGKILACSFNRKAADQLAAKIKAKVGSNNVRCNTMHGVFRQLVVGNKASAGLGSPDERAMLQKPRLISDEGGIKQSALSIAIRNIWEDCGNEVMAAKYADFPPEWFKDGPPKAKAANLYMNQWRGNDIDLASAKKLVTCQAEALAYVWYEMYLGIKGDIPGWRPPAPSGAHERFMKKYRDGGQRLGDMDDMQKILLNILQTDPEKRERVQSAFDHILVDEAQDLNIVQHAIFKIMAGKITPGSGKSFWMIGDDKQCLRSDTLVTMGDGTKRQLGDIRAGDKVLSLRNGEIVPQTVEAIWPSHWSGGPQITTASGKTLAMSPSHKIWVSDPNIPEGSHLVYLMYRADMGYRVGVTNKHGSAGHSYGQRPVHERADKLWVLDIVGNRAEALLLEESYSLEYGIPTCVFEGEHRGLDQNRLNKVFAKFGQNGERLLQARNLKPEIAHWYSCGNTGSNRTRRLIHLNAHGHKGSHVRLEWSGSDLDSVLAEANVAFQVGKKPEFRRIRKWFSNYREAVKFAERLSELVASPVRERLTTDEGSLNLMTASGLTVGMSVAVMGSEGVELDEIVEISHATGKYLDMSVTDASNFFGGDVLSSNCIYQFRGSKPKLFTAFTQEEGWVTRLIKTNYRCAPEIVAAANRLSANNQGNIPMECRAAPGKETGQASILVDVPEDQVAAAVHTLNGIVQAHRQGEPLKNFAVLARTNNELNEFETACIITETPYMRKGGKGFLDTGEAKAMRGYLDLVTGDSYESMRQSLAATLVYPDRGLFMGYDDALKCVEEAVSDLARLRRMDKSQVDPNLLLQPQNVRMLADALKRSKKAMIKGDKRKVDYVYSKWLDELVENLNGLASDLRFIDRTLADKPDQPASELLNSILDGVSSTYQQWDAAAGRTVTTSATLREHISHVNALFSDDEDDEPEEEKTPVEEAEELQVNSEGMVVDPNAAPIVQGPDVSGAGLGSVQFLFQMAQPNVNDEINHTDPTKAAGFINKLSRYGKLAEKLRINPADWEAEHGDVPPPAVTLSTVHKVKGAEWENVTVLMPKGKFPMERKPKKGDPPPDPEKEKKQLEAERNLAYVALTRAQHNLTIVCPKKTSMGQKGGISQFVTEAGLAPGENVQKPGQATDVPPEGAVEVKVASDDVLDLDAQADYYGYGRTSYDRRG